MTSHLKTDAQEVPKIELTTEQQYYLLSVATKRYIASSATTPCQIWFELFAEEISRLGFKVVPK